ncbi:MAG: hypothetical protein WBC92_20275 [Terracidiphilus sp.]
MDKTIRRVTDLEEQEAETYRYWQSQPVGARLVAVCELSEAAYAFAADFKGALADDAHGLQGSSPRIQRKRS